MVQSQQRDVIGLNSSDDLDVARVDVLAGRLHDVLRLRQVGQPEADHKGVSAVEEKRCHDLGIDLGTTKESSNVRCLRIGRGREAEFHEGERGSRGKVGSSGEYFFGPLLGKMSVFFLGLAFTGTHTQRLLRVVGGVVQWQLLTVEFYCRSRPFMLITG